MRIKKVKLNCFRNYKDAEIEFIPGLNIILGKNGQGKTNLLEAVYFLSTTKSHRKAADTEMLQYGEDFFQLDGIGETQEGASSYSAIIHKKGKTFCVKGEPVKKISDYIGKINAVIFSPLDMNLFDASPGDRRRFMDIELGKLSKLYITYLNQYTQLIKSRNNALKQDTIDENLIDVINEQMLEPEAAVIRRRKQFIDQINEYIRPYYKEISETDSEVTLEYESTVAFHPDMNILMDLLRAKQKHSRERDILTRVTNTGIQREDIEFKLDGHPVRIYASQGQKRMIIIALKLALVQIIKKRIDEYPILLLDDVLSELDVDRRNALINLLPSGVQTIITSTDEEGIDERLLNNARIIRIEKGSVLECQNPR